MEEKFLLEMKEITKKFPGVKALDKVTIKIKKSSVHALMGENGAGKSTLMKCLFGIYRKDYGEIVFCGKERNFNSPKEALDNGISMVHQELNQVLQRNIMDNIWLGRYPKIGFFIDEKKMYNDTKKIFNELDIDIDPKKKVSDLSVSEMQILEIAKAVSYNSKIIVMDEPTSSLTEKEVMHLFKIINKLKNRGCGIVYISHKIEEILKIADQVTVMRDGKWISTNNSKDLTTNLIINMMVGRDLSKRFPQKTNVPKEVILEIKNFTAKMQPSFKNINFKLHKGEILGIAGLVGAKRTEILESIFGMREIKTGTIILNNINISNHNPHEAIKNGFALVTEERRATGIFAGLDITFNSIISNIDSYKGIGHFLDNKKMKFDTKWVIDSMKVKTPTQKTLIGNLSGGNQQKVIIGKWLLTDPEILMLDEPTRGIDVGAKFEIYQLMNKLAKKDKGIIIISSEMSELMGTTDRILVMSNGQIADIVETNKTTQEQIMTLSAKFL